MYSVVMETQEPRVIVKCYSMIRKKGTEKGTKEWKAIWTMNERGARRGEARCLTGGRGSRRNRVRATGPAKK